VPGLGGDGVQPREGLADAVLHAPHCGCIASLHEAREQLRQGPRREIKHLSCGLDR
jgi:hypothetical protein